MQTSARRQIAIDFFCGAGGLSLGFHSAGFEVVAAFDLDPIHVSTYKKNFPATKVIEADVAALTGSAVRRLAGVGESDVIDVVCGGPPCQGFSLIGKRGANDPRNLFLAEFARLICELEPRYFVIENVAGLMMGAPRAMLAGVLKLLRSAGYRWVTPIRILDAYDYGVPQSRKRVIILGYRRGELPPTYPKKAARRVTVREAIRDLYSLGRCKALFQSDRFVGQLGPPTTYSQRLRLPSSSDAALTGCQLCIHDRTITERFRQTLPGKLEPVSRFARLRLSAPAPTLRAGTGKDRGSDTAARPIHPTQPRCITVREAARLHSYPDWFQFHHTQWHGFRQVGNSVPPRFAFAVARSIRRALSLATQER